MKRYGLIFLLFMPLFSLASISVNTMRITFPAKGKRFGDILVYNSAKDTAYVAVTLEKLVHPGTKAQKLLPNHNLDPFDFGLVATPIKLVIPANQSRRVRILPLQFATKDEIDYRVVATPEENAIEVLEPNKRIAAGGVDVVVAYAVTIALLPPKPKAILHVSQKGKQLTVSNSGNVSALLMEGKQCSEAPIVKCETLPAHRVYPGNNWHYTLKMPEPIHYTVQSASGRSWKITG